MTARTEQEARDIEHAISLLRFHGYKVELEAARKEFQEADDAWSAELRKAFGRRAGTVRYMPAGEGEPGTPLAAAYERRSRAREQWEAERSASKGSKVT